MKQAQAARTSGARPTAASDLVVCSLEPWDDVWRRNQFLVSELLRRNASMRVLFVEPPADPLHDALHGRMPRGRRLRAIGDGERLYALRPIKPLPRLAGDLSDRVLQRAVIGAAREIGLASPTLWINDVSFAPLIRRSGWPAVYDVTDDWLLAPQPPRALARVRALDEIALRDAREVVVCSPSLEASRSATRHVTLIPNAVDAEHLRRPRARPNDLPPAPVATYVGTLHDARLDIDLLLELATGLPQLAIALVGPDALGRETRRSLAEQGNVHLLGPRAYADVPAYLQHSDVLLMPHRVTPFTESLDPIKAYEYAAIGRPTVATPVAGFRSLEGAITVVARESFVDAVKRALTAPARTDHALAVPSWAQRAAEFESVLASARRPGVEDRG